ETINKNNVGTILAAIALPTDASSSISRKILGASFEEKLFGNAYLKNYKPLSRTDCLAGKVTGLPAAILAESLGLGGGSYTLDAACASSLYAVKLACDELSSFRADAMLAGGVSRPENLYTQVGFSQLKALSPTGRCSPFDERADGLVVGEGAGILVLKRLEDALRDQDRIYAVIRGIGLSNDMRGNLLAPASEGQVRAMRSAYATAGWLPEAVDYIECHATGTPVGDAVELQSLIDLWKASAVKPGQCPIGSIKSMIGHLLTGAGAAGIIKTLLGIQHRVFPPSLNFKRPPQNSPLIDSPFRVQSEAETWLRRDAYTPRRAGVSAFGFGGINSHLLFEEWDPEIEKYPSAITRHASTGNHRQSSIADHRTPIDPSAVANVPIAIVGMAAAFGRLKSLRDFQEAFFKGESALEKRPRDRWQGADRVADRHLDGRAAWGAYLNELTLSMGELHIPPNEIPDILLQHLMMLKVSVSAMQDAGLALREDRPRMGAVIGIDFDYEATDFHLRWNLFNRVGEWKKQNLPGLEDEQAAALWLESLRDACGCPLTAARTLGALAGIIASRIAREFRLGGPSFVVSGEETSGLQALAIAVRSLQQNETDGFLVGGVDLCGDVRKIIISDQIRPFGKDRKIRPFDRSAGGSLPGEGAVALVLKRLDRAVQDQDRIYAVVKGIGAANGGRIAAAPSKEAYLLSLKRCFEDAGIPAASVSLIQTHGSGHPLEDRVEAEALNAFFNTPDETTTTSLAVGSLKPIIGHTGAASGLASLVASSLCLYQEIIPPLKNFTQAADNIWQEKSFHMPADPQYWLRDRQDGPRRACTAAMTTDGNCMHVILESFEYESYAALPQFVQREKKNPLGLCPYGLFAIEGNDQAELLANLDTLAKHLKTLGPDQNIASTARSWYRQNLLDRDKPYAVSLVAGNVLQLQAALTDAENAVATQTLRSMNGPGGVSYTPYPPGRNAETAFVFPGSGNHYIGMGRGLGVRWPEILRRMDAETPQLKTQLVPECYVPWRTSWRPEWE
ncbi:MAG: polyketide synthase, partial [Proteobacteria bacterium]|nr:polyketide synthase [Pseudomonadota bacterium]